MKKLLAVILSVAMLACCVVVASAEEAVTATVETKAGTYAAGDTVTLNVEMSKVAVGYSLITVKNVTCDAEVLEFTGFNKKAMTFAGTADFKAEYSFITTDGGDDYPENQGGVICGLNFKVLKDVTALSEVSVEVIANTYDDAEIIKNTAATVTVVKGGVDVVKEPTAVEKVNEKLNALPAADAVTADDKAAIEEARAAYDALTPAEKEAFDATALAKLVAAEEALAKLVPSDVSTPSTTSSTITSTTSTPSTVTPGGTTSVPKTADNSVVFFAAILCVAMAAAFVITKKVKD